MSEPQLDRLFSRLGNSGFNHGSLAGDRELLDDVLWYCTDPGRAANAVSKLRSVSPDVKKNIIRNLGALYPLTRPIIFLILRDVEYADEFLCLGMDQDQKFLDNLKNIFVEMGKNKLLATRTLEYKREVERLERQAQELRPKYEEKLAREAQLASLRAQTDFKTLEASVAKLDKEIEEFENLLESLRGQVQERQKRRDELKEEENRLKNELLSLQKGADKKRRELLQELFATFDADAEEK